MGDSVDPIDEVLEILAALPIPEDRRTPTRLDAMILRVEVGPPAAWSRTVGHLPGANPATQKQAKRELENFHKALCALDDALFGMSYTALQQQGAVFALA